MKLLRKQRLLVRIALLTCAIAISFRFLQSHYFISDGSLTCSSDLGCNREPLWVYLLIGFVLTLLVVWVGHALRQAKSHPRRNSLIALGLYLSIAAAVVLGYAYGQSLKDAVASGYGEEHYSITEDVCLTNNQALGDPTSICNGRQMVPPQNLYLYGALLAAVPPILIPTVLTIQKRRSPQKP